MGSRVTQPQFTRRTCRPRDAVEQASRDYPGAWGVPDQFRADRLFLPHRAPSLVRA